MEKYGKYDTRYMIEQIGLVSYLVSAYASIFNEPPLQIINRVSWLMAMFHNKNNAQTLTIPKSWIVNNQLITVYGW